MSLCSSLEKEKCVFLFIEMISMLLKFHKVYNKIITAPDASESDRFDAFILKTVEHDRSEY